LLAPSSRRRWGRLQLQTLRAFIALDGRALTSELAGWCWPELVAVAAVQRVYGKIPLKLGRAASIKPRISSKLEFVCRWEG